MNCRSALLGSAAILLATPALAQPAAADKRSAGSAVSSEAAAGQSRRCADGPDECSTAR